MIVINLNPETVKLRLKLDEMSIECSVLLEAGIPTLYIPTELKNTLPIEMCKYASDLFRTSSGIDFNFEITDTSELPVTKTVRNFCVTGTGDVDSEAFENFFENIKVEQCALIYHRFGGKLRENTVLMNIPNLSINHSSCLLPQHLTHFTGKNAKFFNAVFDNIDLNSFLKQWINGINMNLETICIHFAYQHLINLEEILQGIDTNQWDPTKRASQYFYNALFYKPFPEDWLDCSDGIDIERKNDGMIATIKFGTVRSRQLFIMFVWYSKYPQNEHPQKRLY